MEAKLATQAQKIVSKEAEMERMKLELVAECEQREGAQQQSIGRPSQQMHHQQQQQKLSPSPRPDTGTSGTSRPAEGIPEGVPVPFLSAVSSSTVSSPRKQLAAS